MTTPIGGVIAWPGGKIPEGYLLCDGAMHSRDEKKFAALFNAIGTTWGGDGAKMFRLPDFQGLFLRGVSGKSGRDPDADSRSSMYPADTNPGNKGNAVGSYQDDEFKSHTHEIPRPSGRDGNRSGHQDAWFGGPPTSATGGAGGSETRSKNAYVQWIIRFA